MKLQILIRAKNCRVFFHTKYLRSQTLTMDSEVTADFVAFEIRLSDHD